VARLESQMNNIVRMNLPQQVAELQQQLAQLRGQLQVQAHDLKLLNLAPDKSTFNLLFIYFLSRAVE